MELLKESFIHAGQDCLKMLPFLFFAFVLIEIVTHYTGSITESVIIKMNKTGPIIGALAGCIPQCGFSVTAANLYAERIISIGTLLAVFIATSDEAIIIMMSSPGHIKEVGLLLLAKVIIAISAGVLIDRVRFQRMAPRNDQKSDVSACHCRGDRSSILLTAAIHTLKIGVFLFVFTALINLATDMVGMERITEILMHNTIFQPMLAAAIGMIPACVPSVLLTQLYLEGALSFSSLIAGLCAGAGMGLLVLFKANRNKMENLRIIAILYIVAVLAGLVL